MKKTLSLVLVCISLFTMLICSPLSASAVGEPVTLIPLTYGEVGSRETVSFDFSLPVAADVTVAFTGLDSEVDKGTYGWAYVTIKDSDDNTVYQEMKHISYNDTTVTATLPKGNYTLDFRETDNYRFKYYFTVTAVLSEAVHAKTVSLNKKTLKLSVGGTATLTAKYSPSYISDKAVWSSSNKKVATVSSSGKITAKALGTAKIKVKYGSKSATCVVKVTSDKNSISVFTGDKKSVKSCFANISGYKNAKYASSNKKIATVNSSGVVIGKAKGKVTITATINGVKYTKAVTVKNPSITLNETKATLYKGKTKALYTGGSITLKAKTDPSGVKVTWTSSDTKVAKVSEKGKVTAVKTGTATIKASFTYNGKVYSKTCKITVKTKQSITIEAVDWEINSADGVEPNIKITNNTKYDIKYITFRLRFYNAVGDQVSNEIAYDNWEKTLKITGPFKAGATKTFYWDPVFYNGSVHALNVDNVKVIYMDDSSEDISYNYIWYDKYYYKY